MPQIGSLQLMTAPLDTTDFTQFVGPTYQILLKANDSSHLFASTLIENYQVWYDNGGKNFGAMEPFSPTIGTDDLYDVQVPYYWVVSHTNEIR
jgi:hypothetical protein